MKVTKNRVESAVTKVRLNSLRFAFDRPGWSGHNSLSLKEGELGLGAR